VSKVFCFRVVICICSLANESKFNQNRDVRSASELFEVEASNGQARERFAFSGLGPHSIVLADWLIAWHSRTNEFVT
jgi:hypothetical protein